MIIDSRTTYGAHIVGCMWRETFKYEKPIVPVQFAVPSYGMRFFAQAWDFGKAELFPIKGTHLFMMEFV